MNTKTLEYILVIAQEGSLSSAAEKLYMSQPVLSRHLKKIEEIAQAYTFRFDSSHARTYYMLSYELFVLNDMTD